LVVLAAVAAPASAQELPGPLATAHPCQDGFNQLAREDGSAFASPGECVSYSARGGAVIDPLIGESCHLGLGAQQGAEPQLLWTCFVVEGDVEPGLPGRRRRRLTHLSYGRGIWHAGTDPPRRSWDMHYI
jgi:hypothetical protein